MKSSSNRCSSSDGHISSTKPSNSTAVTPLLQSLLWNSSRMYDANKLKGIYNTIHDRNKNIPIMSVVDINLQKKFSLISGWYELVLFKVNSAI